MKRLKQISTFLLVSVVLVACGQQNPGTAAYVGEQRITSDQLSIYLNDLRAVVPIEDNDQGTAQTRGVLARLIIGQIIKDAVSETNAIVDQGLVAQDYAALEKDAGGIEALAIFAGSRNVPPMLIKEVLSQNRAIEAIGKTIQPTASAQVQRAEGDAYILKIANTKKIDINPRYGTWIAQDGSIAPPANELSEPAFATPTDLLTYR
ncbi:MAG: hypothetical protein NWP59_02365 [Candidatus Nanopelagicales bacterium]|nr:hypothetical protein [Candidatus Nanopelagicales bacterium]MDP5107785.1 hypothetical protein [Candidatus Nanopelagicales bacterium]